MNSAIVSKEKVSSHESTSTFKALKWSFFGIYTPIRSQSPYFREFGEPPPQPGSGTTRFAPGGRKKKGKQRTATLHPFQGEHIWKKLTGSFMPASVFTSTECTIAELAFVFLLRG
jgi:hypothetical protein